MMSDTTTNAPRPRPRPRPRPVVYHAESVTSDLELSASRSSGSAMPLGVSGTPLVIEVHDTDEMFMRNKNRTMQTWKNLDKINKDNSKSKKTLSDSDDGSSPRKHKKQKQKSRASPMRQKTKLERLMATDDDSDSDIEILGSGSIPKGKRKLRERSRSRSITPPPDLPEHQLRNARNVVHKALRVAARSPSPTNFDPDESTDTIIFQSELNAIAQEVAKQPHRANSQAPADIEQDHIVLNVTWHPHPLNTAAQKVEWQYRIDRHDSFRDLFDAVADDAHILSANLILTYQGKRLFPSGTPAILNIWTDSAEMAAYDKNSYEYIQKNSFITSDTRVASTSIIPGHNNGIVEIESEEEDIKEQGPYVAQPQSQESEAESEVEGEVFKLILRSSGNKDITLTVRPTTKCGAIVKAFIKKLDLADQYPHIFADAPAKPTKKRGRKSKVNDTVTVSDKDPRLCIDGDKMDNESAIGDMDLEDGDMVEVVGL